MIPFQMSDPEEFKYNRDVRSCLYGCLTDHYKIITVDSLAWHDKEAKTGKVLNVTTIFGYRCYA